MKRRGCYLKQNECIVVKSLLQSEVSRLKDDLSFNVVRLSNLSDELIVEKYACDKCISNLKIRIALLDFIINKL